MLIRITRRWDDKVLYETEATDLRSALQKGVADGAVLRGAVLTGAVLTDAVLRDADLRDADLTGAVRIPTGESWLGYLTDVVPALLTAGGKQLESFGPHFECHTWENCPMAHAFDAPKLSGVPILLRPRAEQFIQFFDAGQIPWPLPTKGAV